MRTLETKGHDSMTGEEATRALPGSVRVGPFDYAIVLDSTHIASGEGRWGHCAQQAFEIHIQENMPTPIKAVDTFLHECLHAVFWAYGVADEDKEERTVAAISTALTALHRDNHWLGIWIKAALETGD
jgi:hypothetical protein